MISSGSVIGGVNTAVIPALRVPKNPITIWGMLGMSNTTRAPLALVVLLFPFIGMLAKMLVRLYPDQKAILTVYLGNMPNEVTDAAASALRNEVKHLFQECQLYNLRMLKIVVDAGYRGYVGIEYEGGKLSEIEGVRATQKLLERVRKQLSA